MRWGSISRSHGASLTTDLVLSLPVALVENLNGVLKVGEDVWSADAGELVLKTIRKAFVVLSNKGDIVPAGAEGMAIEVKCILGSFARIMVAEVFNGNGNVSYWVARAEKLVELLDEDLGVGIPSGGFKHRGAIDKFHLEPVEGCSLKVGKHEGYLRGLFREVGTAERNV